MKREIPLLEGFRFKADASPLSLIRVYRKKIGCNHGVSTVKPILKCSQSESLISHEIPPINCYSQRRLVFWHTTEWVMHPEVRSVYGSSSSGHRRFSPDVTAGYKERVRKWIAYFISRHRAGGKILVPKTRGLKRGKWRPNTTVHHGSHVGRAFGVRGRSIWMHGGYFIAASVPRPS